MATPRTLQFTTAIRIRLTHLSGALIVAVWLVATLLVAETQAADPVPVTLEPSVRSQAWIYNDQFSDEFNSAEVDLAKWNIDSTDFGVWSWEPENVSQKNGSMHLTMAQQTHQRGKQELAYTSGMARMDKTITYGYFEARVKGCSRYPGASPAFWLYSIGPNNRYQAADGETVAYSEIDVIELQQSEYDFETKTHFPVTRIDCNLHTTLLRDGKREWVRPNNFPDICKNHFDAPWDPREDYHVYGAENTKEWIVWYIDGKEVARKPNLYWHLPMHVTLSLGLRYPFVKYADGERLPVLEKTSDEGFPTTMSVDYVRVWQLKESNVDRESPKKTASDWTKDEYVAKEKTTWKKNGWNWNQDKVEANFLEVDANGDGLASGSER
ncbi:family 16 glycosylhydrolase, partial [Rubripirellula amarantea]|nr:family 16 glycosylhydrolase [Rubripirellula amarantea]